MASASSTVHPSLTFPVEFDVMHSDCNHYKVTISRPKTAQTIAAKVEKINPSSSKLTYVATITANDILFQNEGDQNGSFAILTTDRQTELLTDVKNNTRVLDLDLRFPPHILFTKAPQITHEFFDKEFASSTAAASATRDNQDSNSHADDLNDTLDASSSAAAGLSTIKEEEEEVTVTLAMNPSASTTFSPTRQDSHNGNNSTYQTPVESPRNLSPPANTFSSAIGKISLANDMPPPPPPSVSSTNDSSGCVSASVAGTPNEYFLDNLPPPPEDSNAHTES